MNRLVTLFGFFMLCALLTGCSSDDESTMDTASFCTQDRERKTEINATSGILVLLEQKDKYAIRSHVEQSIDAVNYYVLCEKPASISIGDRVNFSGEVFVFDEGENFRATVGGQAYYFLVPSNITIVTL